LEYAVSKIKEGFIMAKKLWGGRFKKEIDSDFDRFQKSIHYDFNLAKYDIYHSKIHVETLERAGILTRAEADKIFSALNKILSDINKGEYVIDKDSEDIHTDIQNKVAKNIGKLALKLHALRSRNDQIVFDEKWYCYSEAMHLLEIVHDKLMVSLVSLRQKYKDQFMIGYTHTQRAQVISFKDYIDAFYSMFARDAKRLGNYLRELFISVGSGALAGSSISKDAYDKSIKLFLDDFEGDSQMSTLATAANTLDNVSSRDFIIEFLSILSILQMHLSRIAEDFIMFSTKEFDFLDLPEEFCTGSSLMPHKKNPDFLELVRGYTGRVYGNLVSVLTTMKGIPFTYNRDMQLDKEPLFSSVEILKDELNIFAKFLKGVNLNKQSLDKALEDETLYATEVAEFLVYKGVAFKDAHDIVGKLVRYLLDNNLKVKDVDDKTLRKFSVFFSKSELSKIMNPKYAVTSKKSFARKLPKIKKVKGKV